MFAALFASTAIAPGAITRGSSGTNPWPLNASMHGARAASTDSQLGAVASPPSAVASGTSAPASPGSTSPPTPSRC